MNKTKSTTTEKSDGVEKPKEGSGSSKDAIARRLVNVQMAQNVLLIWLDNNIDENSDACLHTIAQLQYIVDIVKTFTDVDPCIDFLTDINHEIVFMIISGALCQKIVPLIHDAAQLHTIFIVTESETKDEQWIKKWSKVKDIFTEISPICAALKQTVQQCEQNAISISFVGTHDDLSKKKLDQLDPLFMYTQILKEILLTIQFEQKHIKEFTDYCHVLFQDNKAQLNLANKIEREYHAQTPIWWYTYECFLYPMVNRALRTTNVDIIIQVGFFVRDLHRQIEQLHSKQFNGDHSINETFTLYRGQGLSKSDFEQMTKAKGRLMSFNSFLSTSKSRDLPDLIAESNQSNPDLVGILFVMTIDPSKSTIPFASINGISYFPEEDEILFSMQSVFRIRDIKPLGENDRLFQVDLILTSDNDKDLRVLTDRIREEISPNFKGWYRLGELLRRMGQFDKAQQVFEIILEQTTNESEKGTIYNQLGAIKYDRGEYKEAIAFYERSLEIKLKTLPLNYSDLAISYNNIGLVYDKISQYSKALSSYKKALEILQQSLPPNHPDLGPSYNNIGLVYEKMGEYLKALSSHKNALEIRQQSLPSNHPDLAKSYNNISNLHYSMGDYAKALSSYEKALEIKRKSLPPNHPELGASYNNISMVYYKMGEYSKALSSYEKALEIQQQSLPPNHPDLGASYNNIGLVYYSMDEYAKALSYYEKALEIRQQSLPPNHPDLAISYNNTGNLYAKMGKYSKALSSHKNALEIRQQSLPPNHPDLGTSYDNIGNVYNHMGEYSKGLSSHEKALAIRQQSLASNHPDLAQSYNNSALVYEIMGNYSKALSFYERAVEIAQRSLPANHPHLQTYRNNLKRVKQKL